MKIKFDLRNAAANFSHALAAMSTLSGLNPEAIVKAEAGTILKTCAARTKVASVAKIVEGARLRSLRGLGLTRGDLTINAGLRGPYGRTWSRGQSGKWELVLGDSFAKMPRHVKDSRWAQIANKVEDARKVIAKVIPQAKLTAGLARKSWITIADKLGIKLENVPGGLSAGAIMKARGAVARGGRDRTNGQAREEKSAQGYFVTLINRLPWARRLGLDRTLAAVVAGRAKFFSTAVAKGYRGSLEHTAKLFPGWTVK